MMAGAVVVRFVMGMEGLLGLVTAFTILLTALGLAAMAALFRAAERVMELLEEAVGPDGAEM